MFFYDLENVQTLAPVKEITDIDLPFSEVGGSIQVNRMHWLVNTYNTYFWIYIN